MIGSYRYLFSAQTNVLERASKPCRKPFAAKSKRRTINLRSHPACVEGPNGLSKPKKFFTEYGGLRLPSVLKQNNAFKGCFQKKGEHMRACPPYSKPENGCFTQWGGLQADCHVSVCGPSLPHTQGQKYGRQKSTTKRTVNPVFEPSEPEAKSALGLVFDPTSSLSSKR